MFYSNTCDIYYTTQMLLLLLVWIEYLIGRCNHCR